jgi:hypothetical protein
MEQLFVNLEKERYPSKQAVRTVLASRHPEMDIQAILDGGERWITRLVAAEDPAKLEDSTDDLPPLPGDDAPEGEDAPKDEAKDEEDKGDKKDEDKAPKAEKKDKGPKDLAGKVEKLISELTGLLDDLGGATSELQGAHDEKAEKLDAIGDLAGGSKGEASPDEGMSPEDIGPVPGGPDVSEMGPPPVPTGPHPPKGFDKRKKPDVGVPAFTNNKMVSVPLFRDNGERVTAATAINRIYAMPKYAKYEVSGIQPDEDNDRYVAHLVLRED